MANVVVDPKMIAQSAFVVRQHCRPIVSVFEACVALDSSMQWMADRPYVTDVPIDGKIGGKFVWNSRLKCCSRTNDSRFNLFRGNDD